MQSRTATAAVVPCPTRAPATRRCARDSRARAEDPSRRSQRSVSRSRCRRRRSAAPSLWTAGSGCALSARSRHGGVPAQQPMVRCHVAAAETFVSRKAASPCRQMRHGGTHAFHASSILPGGSRLWRRSPLNSRPCCVRLRCQAQRRRRRRERRGPRDLPAADPLPIVSQEVVLPWPLPVACLITGGY